MKVSVELLIVLLIFDILVERLGISGAEMTSVHLSTWLFLAIIIVRLVYDA